MKADCHGGNRQLIRNEVTAVLNKTGLEMPLPNEPSGGSANLLLASLPVRDAEFLASAMRIERPPLGQFLGRRPDAANEVWFPLNAVIALIMTDDEGRTVQTGLVGPEGCIGLETLFFPPAAFGHPPIVAPPVTSQPPALILAPALPYGPALASAPGFSQTHAFSPAPLARQPSGMSQTSPLSEALVQVAGDMAVIPASHLRSAVETRPATQTALFRFLFELSAQSLQTVACNRLHSLEARCCRWLLMLRDRTGSDDLPLTQECLATMLGSGRPRINSLLASLEQSGLVQRHRGRIQLRSRQGLSRRACECYRLVKYPPRP